MRDDDDNPGGPGRPVRPAGFAVDSGRLIDHAWHWEKWAGWLRTAERVAAPGAAGTEHFGRVLADMGSAHDAWHTELTCALRRGEDSCLDISLALRRAAQNYDTTDARHTAALRGLEQRVGGGHHG